MAFSTFSHALSSSRLFFSLPQFPLSPSVFSNVAYVLAVAPALCAPARVARAMASDFHANLNVAAGVVSGTLTTCGSTPLAVWVSLPKRRGNAGSDSELSYHLNTFLEVRWGLRLCVFSHSHSHSLSLRNLSDCPSARTHAHFSPLSPLSPSSPLLFFVFVFALSSSLSYLLPPRNSFLFFFTSASSSLCFSSLLSSSHLFLPC